MKLLLIAASNFTGGAQKILINLNDIFNSSGFESRIIFLKGEKNWEGKNFQTLENKNILSKIIELRKIINQFEPDVVISTPTHINIFVIIVRMFTKCKPKLVIRQATHYSYEKKNNVGFTSYYLSLLAAKWLYQKSDKVISLTDSMQKDLIENIINISEKTVVLKNPTINEKEYKSRQNIDLISDRIEIKRLVYIGRLSKQKNIPLLCSVMRNLKDKGCSIHLDIYGQGDYEYLVRNEIEQSNINATIHGFVDKPFENLTSNDLLLLVSKYEGSPNVIIESMYNYIPFIATDCPGGPKDIINESEFGVLSKNDESSIVSNILSITENGYSVDMLKRAKIESLKYNYSSAGQTYIDKVLEIK